MKYLILFFVPLLFLNSCNNSNSESNAELEADSDSSNNQIEEEEEDLMWPQGEEGYVDSLVPFEREIETNSKYSNAQIEEDTRFQFYKNNLAVYDNNFYENKIDEINVGDTVKLIQRSGEFRFVDNFIGSEAKLRLSNDTVGFASDNFLLPVPYPSDELKDRSLKGYLEYYLHETGPTVERGKFHGDRQFGLESEWFEIERHFERDITYTKTEHYESGADVVFIPKLSIEQAFFLIDALDKDHEFLKITEGFPMKERYEFKDEDWGPSYIEIDCSWGAILALDGVKIQMGDGCGSWIYIRHGDGGTEIETGSGC